MFNYLKIDCMNLILKLNHLFNNRIVDFLNSQQNHFFWGRDETITLCWQHKFVARVIVR